MSYSSRVRRQRNTQTQETDAKEGFFSNQHDDNKGQKKNTFFQPKLSINQPGDSYEQEANSVANAVVNNTTDVPVVHNNKISSVQRLATPVEDEKLGTNDARLAKDKEIQEKPIQLMQTDNEKKEPEGIQKKDAPLKEEDEMKKTAQLQKKGDGGTSAASPQLSSRIESSAGKGTVLPAKTLQEMSTSFGVDFSDVHIHKDIEATKMNKELNAQAFTHGSDIYINEGKYDTGSIEGKSLLAHELTHVVQQSPDKIARKKLGSKFVHDKGVKSPHKKITALFDGRNFTVFADSVQVMQTTAQSGRPYSVREKDAKACGGSTGDSYLNNPLYVGIGDNGPIPEGSFNFKASEFSTFSSIEQAEMLLGGDHTDAFGKPMHGGDWGSGRVALKKINVKPGKKGCGDTSKRSGFYLHGGIMPGSSGCIDIGNNGINSLLGILNGFTGNMTVNVKYLFPAPDVNVADRALGRFMYPKVAKPTLLDRVKSVFGD